MTCRKIIAFDFDDQMKHIKTLCERNIELPYVEVEKYWNTLYSLSSSEF
jgi:hypothetical protein